MRSTELKVTTSVERVFKFEILIIKLCAGFTFQAHTRPKLALLYRIVVQSLTAVFRAVDYPQDSGDIPKSTRENLRIFYSMYSIASVAIVLGSLATGLKYHNLIAILTRKQFDPRLLGPSDHPSSSLMHSPNSSIKSLSSSLLSSASSLILHRRSIDRTTASNQLRSSPETQRHRPMSRIRLLRILMLAYVLVSSLMTLFREKAPIYIKTRLAAKARAMAVAEALGYFGLNTSTSASSEMDRIETAPFEGTTLIRFVVELAFCIVRNVFSTAQVYGSICVSLMLLAVFSDMLANNCNEELIGAKLNFIVEAQKRSSGETSSQLQLLQSSDSSDRSDATSGRFEPKKSSKRASEMTDLLIHMRDALIVLRYAMSLDYLMLMVFDTSRLMFIFCIFSAFVASKRRVTALVAVVEFLRVCSGALMCLLGYYWLHNNVRQFKRQITEKNYLNDARFCRKYIGSSIEEKSSVQMSKFNRHENIILIRLATEIENLWPTDWYEPDICSYIAQIFFVVTFVATLQQLVEAGDRVEQLRGFG